MCKKSEVGNFTATLYMLVIRVHKDYLAIKNHTYLVLLLDTTGQHL